MSNIYRDNKGRYTTKNTWEIFWAQNKVKPTQKIKNINPIFKNNLTKRLERSKIRKELGEERLPPIVYTRLRWSFFAVLKKNIKAPDFLDYIIRFAGVTVLVDSFTVSEIKNESSIKEVKEKILEKLNGNIENLKYYDIHVNSYTYRRIRSISNRQVGRSYSGKLI